MKINEFLEEVCEEIKYKPVRPFISEELKQHLLEAKEEKVKEENLPEEVAEEQVTAQMGEPKQIGKKLNKIHRPKLDWQLLCLIIILVIFGIFNNISKLNANYGDTSSTIIYIMRDIVIGAGIGSIVYFCNYKKMQKHSNMIYFIATLINILPAIMPAMISVPLYVIAFCGFLVDSKEKRIKEIHIFGKEISLQTNGIVKIVMSSILAVALIMSLPSVANAVILNVIYLIVGTIYIWKTSENRKRMKAILYGGILTIVLALIALYNSNNIIAQRMIYSLKPEMDPQGQGYVGMLQKEIIENSKMIGGANTKIITESENILTEESNYTFIYLMGKLGILAVGILVIVVILTALKIIFNAKLMKNMYGKMITIGLGTLYILQSVINILMNLNLGVQTNVNLPFVCEGSTYFIINCISIAFILSIYRRKDIELDLNVQAM